MRFAINVKKEKIVATFSGQRGRCPTCLNAVVGRCGDLNVDHWAHLSGSDCDPWSEPLTRWHVDWQNCLAIHRGAKIEETIIKNGETHRADAVLPDGKIVELQHSFLSVEKIKEREHFYGKNLIWVFDARKAYDDNRFIITNKGNYDNFRWLHPRKSVAFASGDRFLDLGYGKIFQITKMFQEPPYAGYGKLKHSYTLEYNT